LSHVGTVLLALSACASTDDGRSESVTQGVTVFGDVLVATELCDKTYPSFDFLGNPQQIPFAEHAYPGKSKFELTAHVQVARSVPQIHVPGYEISTAYASGEFRDGFVAAGCSPGDTVYFIYH
jgi:hypothetical protein